MTDNEIIKALECCKDGGVCTGCPLFEQKTAKCISQLNEYTLDLINRQKAEIERLSHKCGDCAGCTQWKCDCSNIKSEAIREFVEKLKEKASHETYHDSYGGEKFSYTISTVDFDDIDQTVDEMDGDTP